MNIKHTIIEALKEGPKSLQELYEIVEAKQHTIRARLNEGVGKNFSRVGRGWYALFNDETGGSALIIQGDAWKILPTLEDDSFDAIITDSPYTAVDEQMQKGTTRARNLNRGWNFKTRDIDLPLMQHLHRVLKPNGFFFTMLPAMRSDTWDYNANHKTLAEEAGFNFCAQWVWDKKAISLGYCGRPRHELIFMFVKGKFAAKNTHDRSIPDVLEHKRVPWQRQMTYGSDDTRQQTQKPASLLMDIMKYATAKGGKILDPFAGSCSLGEAALALGRKAVCIEFNPDVAKAAHTRLANLII
jgi:site-specific DNA-methyltransferase (adenine-specific)